MKKLKIAILSVTLIFAFTTLTCKTDSSRQKSLQEAIDKTIVEARQAIDLHGETAEAMGAIEESLRKLAEKPGLKQFAELKALHGGIAMAAKPLASEGEDGITLFIVRFQANNTTRVHDHLSWGVIHVLEGRDKYVQWTESNENGAQIKSEIILKSGQSTYWLPPPNDIHSQESMNAEVWEIIVAGKNLMSPIVTDHRHYYEPEGLKE